MASIQWSGQRPEKPFACFETCSASSGWVAVVGPPEQKRRDTRIGNNILLPITLVVKVGTVKLTSIAAGMQR